MVGDGQKEKTKGRIMAYKASGASGTMAHSSVSSFAGEDEDVDDAALELLRARGDENANRNDTLAAGVTPSEAAADMAIRKRCFGHSSAVSGFVLLVLGLSVGFFAGNRWGVVSPDKSHICDANIEADGTRYYPSTLPTSRPQKSGWMEYHNILKATAEQEGAGARVLLIGDSITEELLGTSLGYPRAGVGNLTVWEEYYAPYGTINLGVSGDQTQHVLWRLQHGELPGVLQPEAIMVAIGTNNLGSGMSSDDTVEGVVAIVKYVHEQRPDALVCVMALFPRSIPSNQTSSRPWRTIRKVNKALETRLPRHFDEEQVRFVDCTDGFQTPSTHSKTLNPDYIMEDNLHLTTAGLGAWAECAKAPIQSGLRGT